jgi:hypothetical protein
MDSQNEHSRINCPQEQRYCSISLLRRVPETSLTVPISGCTPNKYESSVEPEYEFDVKYT